MNTRLSPSRVLFIAALLPLLLSIRVPAQAPPGLLSYQGRLVVGGTNFDGTGQFKFALVDGPGSAVTTLWSNDGSSLAGGAPSNAVQVAVTKGLYSVLLGETNHMWISPNVFTNADVRLRVWFSPDSTISFEHLLLDQRIASVGYALMAANVADGAITSNKLAPGAIGAAQLPASPVFSGTVSALSFVGNGGGLTNLTNLNASNLTSGLLPDARLSANVVRLGSSQTFTGANAFTSPGNSFSGDGSGLKNVVPAAKSVDTAQLVKGSVTSDKLAPDPTFAGTVTISNHLALPATGANGAGSITLGGSSFLHSFGIENTFVGESAGNFQMTGPDNTGIGRNALRDNTSGFGNTANGVYALLSNTNGFDNTANGAYALQSNTSGSDNTANGAYALQSNTSGFDNTANGAYALRSNTTGNYNTAIGLEALLLNTTGSYNTAIGESVLYRNTTGEANTANGFVALFYNTTGRYNTANGAYALRFNTTGYSNTAIGSYALLTNTTGNYNTAIGDDALASQINGDRNIGLGVSAGIKLVTGNDNMYFGNLGGGTNESGAIRIGTPGVHTATHLAGVVHGDASGLTNVVLADGSVTGTKLLAGSVSNNILANSSITFNLAPASGLTGDITKVDLGGALTLGTTATPGNTPSSIVQRDASGNFEAATITVAGNLALPATSGPGVGGLTMAGISFLHAYGSSNTFLGLGAGNFTTSGSENTAVGAFALTANEGGFWNTAAGAEALPSNSTGAGNTAVGTSALAANSTGNENTAVGLWALKGNTNGIYNTAIGVGSLLGNSSGIYNTAIGVGALYINNGDKNIAVGQFAGQNHTLGDNNIYVGNGGFNEEFNTIRLGDSAIHTNATYIAGIFGAVLGGGSPVSADDSGRLGTVVSSLRFKEAIHDMAGASDVILGLRPVTFHYKPEFDPKGRPQFGLIAEEVNELAPELIVRNAQGEIQTVRYEAVNAMLLNEFQKEHRRVEQQERTIGELKKQVGELSSQLAGLTALIQKVSAQLEPAKSAPPETAVNRDPAGL